MERKRDGGMVEPWDGWMVDEMANSKDEEKVGSLVGQKDALMVCCSADQSVEWMAVMKDDGKAVNSVVSSAGTKADKMAGWLVDLMVGWTAVRWVLSKEWSTAAWSVEW